MTDSSPSPPPCSSSNCNSSNCNLPPSNCNLPPTNKSDLSNIIVCPLRAWIPSQQTCLLVTATALIGGGIYYYINKK